MNRILLSILCFILFTNTNYAQYTSIINANRPGDTESAYSVGRRVFQIENSLLHNTLDNSYDTINANSFSNDINLQYGFWSERLQASLNHRFTHGEFTPNTNKITGTENLSIGLKYLIYEYVRKETPEQKRSWKKRYGFQFTSLIPSIAIAAKYHTPFSDDQFFNGASNSFSFSLITQNNISKKLRINNQLEYRNFTGDYTKLVYSASSSYVLAKRWNPYIQYQFHSTENNNDPNTTVNYNYSTLGIGTPFLINRNLAMSVHYNASFGKNISGQEIGFNIAFRIDKHYDRWEYIDQPKKEKTSKIKEKESIEKDEASLNNEEKKFKNNSDDDQSLDDFLKEIAEEKPVEEKKPKKEKKVKKKKEKKEKPADDFILSY